MKKIWRLFTLEIFFPLLSSLLLITSTVIFVLLLFFHALNENAQFPAIGLISGDQLELFWGSWYVFILGGILVLIPLVVIVLINKHHLRRIFLSVGVSLIASGLISIMFGFIGKQIVKIFSGEWQDILVNETSVFKDFCIICAISLIVLGAACLSFYSCIIIIKGDQHEKET